MELSKRLQAVADLVTAGYKTADIGTDHAYIPIYLVEQNIVPSAIAMDVNKGPLERAEAHVRENGLEEKISLRLSDGFGALCPGEADAAILAGMGGGLVMKILKDNWDVTTALKECILQPQSEIAKVRAFLLEEGFLFIAEDMVLEDGKFYPMMKVIHGEKMHISEDTPYTLDEWFGGMLLERKHPVLREYLERELRIRNEILDRLKNAPNAEKRAGEIEEEKQAVIAALEEYEGI